MSFASDGTFLTHSPTLRMKPRTSPPPAKSMFGKRPEKKVSPKWITFESVKKTYEEQTDPRYGAARLWIDKIIDPVGTRDAIVLALEAAALNPDVPEFTVGVLQT